MSAHGVSTALRNGENDGWAAIEEDAEGHVIVTVEATAATRANVEIKILPSPQEAT